MSRRASDGKLFVDGRPCSSSGATRAKLGYFWRHSYRMPNSGRYRGCVVNPASGAPVMTDEGRLTIGDFDKVRIAEVLTQLGEKPCLGRYAPLWQADNRKIRRVAPVDFISRYEHATFCTS